MNAQERQGVGSICAGARAMNKGRHAVEINRTIVDATNRMENLRGGPTGGR